MEGGLIRIFENVIDQGTKLNSPSPKDVPRVVLALDLLDLLVFAAKRLPSVEVRLVSGVDGFVFDLVGRLVEGLEEFGEAVGDRHCFIVELRLAVLDANVGVVDLLSGQLACGIHSEHGKGKQDDEPRGHFYQRDTEYPPASSSCAHQRGRDR